MRPSLRTVVFVGLTLFACNSAPDQQAPPPNLPPPVGPPSPPPPQPPPPNPPSPSPPSPTPPPTPSPPPATVGLIVPDAGLLYHGVYPGGTSGEEDDLTPADEDAYERAAGRQVAWVYFSNNWFRSRAFPRATAEWIRARGAVPFIRLMLRSSTDTDIAEPVFKLQKIVDGDFDSDLRAWADAAKAFGTPVIVEWGTEANGQWFSWNGVWNGGATDGPKRFREAYRHIVTTMLARGATNITWVFHVDAHDDPEVAWNALENYYPGDDIVDWLGVSVYGAQNPQEKSWSSFESSMNDVVPRLTKLAPRKPIFVLEFGHSAGVSETSAHWADAAFAALLADDWPAVRGFSWWNEHFSNDNDPQHDTDMRVQSVPGLSEVFSARLKAASIVDRPIIKP